MFPTCVLQEDKGVNRMQGTLLVTEASPKSSIEAGLWSEFFLLRDGHTWPVVTNAYVVSTTNADLS